MRNKDNIKQNYDGNVTMVSNDEQSTITHKNVVRNKDNINQNEDGNVTMVRDDEQGKTTHKNEVRNKDNINQNKDGNVTMVRDDEQGKTTHKNEVGNYNKSENKSNDVTLANSGRKPRKAHKSKFLAPKRKPTKIEERRMIGKAVSVLILSCMNNHVYKFNNKLRIQSRGGPIGLGLTGEIADCFMIKWDKQFLEKC